MMEASDVQLPFATQGALLSLHIGRILQAAEHSQAKFDELIKATAPWGCTVPDAFKPMDRTTWVLRSLGNMTEKAKVEWFSDTIFSGFLVKLLEEGEARASHASAFALHLQSAWEEEVETEVGDATAQCMETILRCVRCLLMLHSFDMDMMTSDAWEDLDYIMKRAAATGSGADVLFAITMQENDYWSGRVKKLGDARSGIQQHGAQLKLDTDFLDSLCPAADFASPEIPKVLQRLCLYTTVMPDEAIAQFLKLAKGKIMSAIKVALGCMTSGRHDVLKPLHAMAHEASLAFSLDAEVDELISQIHSKSKQSALHAILQKCVELSSAMKEVTTADLDASLEMKAFIDYTSDCSVGQLPEEHVPHFVAVLESCLAALPQLLAVSAEEQPMTLKACSIIASWLDHQAPLAKTTLMWQKVWELQGATHKYLKLGETVQARMDADTAADGVQWPLLTTLRQSLQVLADPSIPASLSMDSDLKQQLQQSMEQAKSVQEEVSKHALDIKSAIVTEKLNMLEPLAGGMDNGVHWMESLGDAASWDVLVSLFKVTMGKNSADTLVHARGALQQVSMYTIGCIMHTHTCSVHFHAWYVITSSVTSNVKWASAHIVCLRRVFTCMCRTRCHLQVLGSTMLPNSTYTIYVPGVSACVCREHRYLHVFGSLVCMPVGPLIPGVNTCWVLMQNHMQCDTNTMQWYLSHMQPACRTICDGILTRCNVIFVWVPECRATCNAILTRHGMSTRAWRLSSALGVARSRARSPLSARQPW